MIEYIQSHPPVTSLSHLSLNFAKSCLRKKRTAENTSVYSGFLHSGGDGESPAGRFVSFFCTKQAEYLLYFQGISFIVVHSPSFVLLLCLQKTCNTLIRPDDGKSSKKIHSLMQMSLNTKPQSDQPFLRMSLSRYWSIQMFLTIMTGMLFM